MGWKDGLTEQTKSAYKAAEGLIAMLHEENLDWKPPTGENWMTVGQLLEHLVNSCGLLMRWFVTDAWDLSHNEMLPAEKMKTIGSLVEAKDRLAKDKEIAFETLAGLTDEDLCDRMVAAPWNPTPQPLGTQLGFMVAHLESHKSQLFYYMKLMGKPVHTGHLWGV